MKIQFVGATEGVTGSCFLITHDNLNILIDCGMYQEKELEYNNYSPFPFDPGKIDFLILTHAHLDHCGLIPKLFNLGFKGNVYCSYATLEISKIILYDAAKIQELNLKRGISDSTKLIYNTLDVDYAISKFRPIEVEKDLDFSDICKFRLIPVGHVLGATSILVEIFNKTILFSGDIGRLNQSIINSFNIFDYSKYAPDYIIMESLYGTKIHPDKNIDIEKIANSINKIYTRNSKLLLPVFSLHRAQEMLEIINYFFCSNRIPKDCKVFLDSPMAKNITDIYQSNVNQLNSQTDFLNDKIEYIFSNSIKKDIYSKYVIKQTERFVPNNLKIITKSNKSKKLINAKNAIILAGSGMAEGGRIIKHLYNGLEDSDNIICFVGYQAKDTLGRKLVDGEKTVTIVDKKISVRSEILYLRAFSAHGDNKDLNAWLNKFDLKKLSKIFLVHGEVLVKEEFAQQLKQTGFDYSIPSKNEVYEF
jgi:metallo-beta-lactamase family protein